MSTRADSEKSLDVEQGKPTATTKHAAGQFQVETRDVFDEGESGVDPVYQAKARILNDAFQEIGMGRYQVRVISLPVLLWKRTGLTVDCSGGCLS